MNYSLLYKKTYLKITTAKNILALCHVRPDGDALGSLCAFADMLEGLKKNFTCYSADRAPDNFSYLPHVEKIVNDKAKINFSAYDLIITLDCGDLKRTGLAEEIKNRNKAQTVINIDHHPIIDEFADINIKNPTAASTTEIVYDLFKTSGLKINKNIAICILTGLSVDTGNFIYPSTSKKTINISAEMLEKGAKMTKIMEKTFRSRNLAGLQAWGKAMTRLKINKKYNFAFTALTLNDTAGISEEDLEGLTNYLGNLKNVNGVLIIYEKEKGIIKGSLRTSHPTTDVSILARQLGGGGHAKASGFTIEGKLEKRGDSWWIV